MNASRGVGLAERLVAGLAIALVLAALGIAFFVQVDGQNLRRLISRNDQLTKQVGMLEIDLLVSQRRLAALGELLEELE